MSGTKHCNECYHDIRNGVVNIYDDRKIILKEILKISSYIESRKLPKIAKFILITLSMRKQLSALQHLETQLARIMEVTLTSHIKIKEAK